MADEIDITKVKNIEALKIDYVHDISPLKIDYVHDISPLTIEKVKNIAPIAAHIKEVNHIDPISVDAFHVSEVRNIEPISVERFDVTNLPLVNISLRQVPALDMDVRRVPPLSISIPQNFDIPSRYTVRARLFGIEFLRVLLTGNSIVLPRERYRQEQEKSPERSFPLVAVAGNPAIPSIREEKSVEVHYPPPPPHPTPVHPPPRPAHTGYRAPSPCAHPAGPLRFGLPGMNFHMPGPQAQATHSESTVGSGG